MLLGFHKIKDLANTTLTVASTINILGKDSMAALMALQIYDQDLDEQFKSAKSEYSRNNYVKTQEICKGLLVHKPTDVKVLVLLGSSYICSGEYSLSSEYLLKAYEIDPNSAEVFMNYGVLEYYLGNFEKASTYIIKSYTIRGVSNLRVDDFIEFAQLMTIVGSKEEASTLYKIILCASPDLYKERNAYAKVLMTLNRFKQAEIEYKIATETAPHDIDTWNNLGNLYKRMDWTKEAICCYKKASELYCTSPTILTILGNEYLKLKEYQYAIDNFKKALALFPENPIDTLIHLGNVYCHQKNWSLFIDTYEEVWKLKSRDEQINYRLGYVYFHHLNNYQKAEKYFINLVNINPQNETFHNYLICVYEKQSKMKYACKAAISLAQMFERQKNYKDAKNAYVLALHFEPEDAYGHLKLGNNLYSQGHLEAALERYEYAIGLNQDYSRAHFLCGKVYEKMNLFEKALEHYNKAHALMPKNKSFKTSGTPS